MGISHWTSSVANFGFRYFATLAKVCKRFVKCCIKVRKLLHKSSQTINNVANSLSCRKEFLNMFKFSLRKRKLFATFCERLKTFYEPFANFYKPWRNPKFATFEVQWDTHLNSQRSQAFAAQSDTTLRVSFSPSSGVVTLEKGIKITKNQPTYYLKGI